MSGRSFFAKEPLIIGLCCGKWHIKRRSLPSSNDKCDAENDARKPVREGGGGKYSWALASSMHASILVIDASSGSAANDASWMSVREREMVYVNMCVRVGACVCVDVPVCVCVCVRVCVIFLLAYFFSAVLVHTNVTH